MRRLCQMVVASLALVVTPLFAQDYPTKPILLVVPFAPGGSSDFLSRLIGAKLTEAWKQQVVVESRPGGAGNIAMEAVQRAKPDGYTLILGHVGTLAVNPAMFATLPYDPVKGFIPVSMIATVPTLLVVNPNLPVKDFKEFVALAKAKPGTIYYGSAGNGSSGHLAMEYLKQAAGIDLVHVPYKGTGPMVTDLLGDRPRRPSPAPRPSSLISSRASCDLLRSAAPSALRRFPICRRSRSRASRDLKRRSGTASWCRPARLMRSCGSCRWRSTGY